MPENTPTLKTERLILRKFSEADLPALFDLLCDAEVNTFLPWFPMRSLKETEAFFRERDVYKRQVLVGANSPSLCPTISSVI